MYFLILIIGLALWVGAHFFKRVAPERRAAIGDSGKGAVALAIVSGVVLMVIGYRGSEFIPIWEPEPYLRHVNNLMVLIAIYMMSPAPKKGRLLHGMRHPMLTGFALWAAGHLLVNGDLTAIITFGGLLIWALAEMSIINKAEGGWRPEGEPGPISKDAIFFGASVVLLAVIGWIHAWLGYPPFGA